MARRGDILREHILDTAKAAFLETGFERTSMDALATRAATSKRSLYAHFPTKDVLLIAVVDRTRELFRDRIGTPADYAEDPVDAAVRFCGRLLQLLRWSSVTRTLRLGIADADRLPDMAAGLYDVLIGEPTRTLAGHLATTSGISPAVAADLADRLIGATVHPAMTRLLAGIDPTVDDAPDVDRLGTDVDLDRLALGLRPLLVTAFA